jgi:hypothetical protein
MPVAKEKQTENEEGEHSLAETVRLAKIELERLETARQRRLDEGPEHKRSRLGKLRQNELRNLLRRLGLATTGLTQELKERLVDASREKLPMGMVYTAAAKKAREEYDANTPAAADREAYLCAASKEMKRLGIGALTKKQRQYLAKNWQMGAAAEMAAAPEAALAEVEALRPPLGGSAQIRLEEHPPVNSVKPSRSRGGGGGQPVLPEQGGDSGVTLFCYGTVRSHCHFALPLIHFTPYHYTIVDSAPIFLKRQCDRALYYGRSCTQSQIVHRALFRPANREHCPVYTVVRHGRASLPTDLDTHHAAPLRGTTTAGRLEIPVRPAPGGSPEPLYGLRELVHARTRAAGPLGRAPSSFMRRILIGQGVKQQQDPAALDQVRQFVRAGGPAMTASSPLSFSDKLYARKDEDVAKKRTARLVEYIEAAFGLGHIIALYYSSTSSYQIR